MDHSVSLSQRDRKEKVRWNPLQVHTPVQNSSVRDSWDSLRRVDATGCSAMKKCDLVSQSHMRPPESGLYWCSDTRVGFGGSPNAPSALGQLPDFSSLGAWWLWKIQSPFNTISHKQEKITKQFVTNYLPCSKNNQLISLKKRAQRFSASTWAFFPKENFIMVNISRTTVVHMVNSCFNMIWHNNCLEIISLTFL